MSATGFERVDEGADFTEVPARAWVKTPSVVGAVGIAPVRLLVTVMTYRQNVLAGLSTAAALQRDLSLTGGDVGVFCGVSGVDEGRAGALALLSGTIALLDACLRLPPAFDLIMICEDDAEVADGLAERFGSLIKSVAACAQPVCLLGYACGLTRDKTRYRWGKFRPRNGTTAWVVRAAFLRDLVRGVRAASPRHLDSILLSSTLRGKLAYSSLIVVGFGAHKSACADAKDPNDGSLRADGWRLELRPRFSAPEWESLRILSFSRGPAS